MKKFEEELSRKIDKRIFGWEADLTNCIFRRQLSEDFIKKYKDNFGWRWRDISAYQTFSESFLREMKDYIIWESIDNTDSFSVDFIREFKRELDLNHRRLRNEIKGEFNYEY